MEQVMAKLLQDFEHGKMNRRQLIQSLALTATAASVASATPAVAADDKPIKAAYINHGTYDVPDYAKPRAFYSSLFGLQVSQDDGKRCNLTIGNNLLILQNRPSETSRFARVDHIAYTVTNWDTDKNVRVAMEADVKRR